jgi:small subunit ribosomal protein S1
MAESVELRPVPADDRSWWAAEDESYWLALLEQGEIAPLEPVLMEAQGVASGDSLPVPPLEADPQQELTDLSEGAALPDQVARSVALYSLQPGDVCTGSITNLTTFGAFVDIGGIEGLVHVSEISWERVHHPGDVLRPGQEVQVYVLGVKPEEGRIALSLKRMQPDPWCQAESRYQAGQLVQGIVTNVVSFGAFVRLEEGLEGLVHVSEMATGSFLHPRNVLREGDTVQARVLSVDAAHRRLGLSLRQAYGLSSGAGS